MSDFAFIDLFLRSVALAGIAWMLLRIFPRGHAGREWVLLGGFAALGLLAASIFAPLPRVELGVLPVAPDSTTPALHFGRWIMAVWAAGAALVVAREVLAQRRLRGILSASQPADEALVRGPLSDAWSVAGVRGAVEVRVAGKFGPAATGLWRRIVVLPESSAAWDAETMRYVLAHELTHFRRRDPWTHACVRLVCAVQWFNPFVHLLRRELEAEREFACDRLAMRAGNAAGYGECLLSLAGGHLAKPLGLALAMGATGGRQLEWRIRHLFRESPRLRMAEMAVLALLLALLAAFAFVSPFAGREATAWQKGEIERRLAANPFPGNR